MSLGTIIIGGEPSRRRWSATGRGASASSTSTARPRRPSARACASAIRTSGTSRSWATQLPGVYYHVLDEHQQHVKVGGTGEALHFFGRCLARGYRNRPQQTQEKFPQPGLRPLLPHRRPRPAAGPTASWSSSARVDRMIKLRGILIEPIEIEIPLRDVDGVSEAAVVLRDGGLVAFLTGAEIPSRRRDPQPPLADAARLDAAAPLRPPGRHAAHDERPARLRRPRRHAARAGTRPRGARTLGVLLSLANELLGTTPTPPPASSPRAATR